MIIFTAQSQRVFSSQAPFHDPAIMSAKLASPILTSVSGYNNQATVEDGFRVMSDSLSSLTSQVTHAAPSAHLGPHTKPSSPAHGKYLCFEGRVCQGQCTVLS